MARVVDELPEPQHYTRPRHPLPWDEWLNGYVWLIEHDDISHTNTDTFIVQAHNAARRRGLKINTRQRPEGTYIRAYVPSSDDAPDEAFIPYTQTGVA